MSNTGGINLVKFYEDVDAIKDELRDLETLYNQLHSANKQSKNLHNAKALKELRTKMDNNVSVSLKKAKSIKVRLEALDRSNTANRSIPGCGPGSSSDRTMTSIANGLRKKLQNRLNHFNELRQQMAGECRETVQGRGQVMDTVMEIQEIEKNLKELHQVFLDMAVLVESQGDLLDNIESHVQKASSFVRGGTQQLEAAARKPQNTRKWICYGIILLLITILIIVLLFSHGRNENKQSKFLAFCYLFF